APPALDRIREGSNGRGDLRAGDDGELGGSPARRCAKPAVHVAPIGSARQPDRSRQRRGGGAGVGLSGVAEPSARASSAARQEDPGGRDTQGGSGTRHELKKTYGAPRSQVVSTHDSLTQSASTYPVSEILLPTKMEIRASRS